MEETLGQRIRRLRKFARMTQQTLADRAGVSHSQISGIETDDRKSGPSSSQIMPLAIALGVSADYLLSGIAPLQAVPDRSAGQGDELAMLTGDMAPTSFMMVGQPPKRPRGVAPTAWIVQIVPLVQQYIHAGGGRPDDPESLSAGASSRTPDAADAAALAVVSDLRRTLDALHADLNDMRAELAALRERDEQAAQQRQDAARTAEAVLERIERAVRRVPWWKRWWGR